MAPVARAALAALLGLASGGRIDRDRHHDVAHARATNLTAAELEAARTKELLGRASAETDSAKAILKAVQDAGIYKAAENLRKAKAQEAAQQQQKLLGTLDLMLRAPAPAKDRKQDTKKPVSAQVTQKDMDAFVATLSTACGKQFTAIMTGSAPAIHTFGEADSNCSKLEGTLCDTEAQIESIKSGPADRHMRSLQHATGHGCLPQKCTDNADLTALAGFMQSRAKEALPGSGVLVKLSVDCTESGGAAAKVGYDESSTSVGQLDKPARGAGAMARSHAARRGALAALVLGFGATL